MKQLQLTCKYTGLVQFLYWYMYCFEMLSLNSVCV
jgi:hypothetical protein